MTEVKPKDYPLPWCDALGVPYWQVNLMLCSVKSGWPEFQASKPMAAIIPRIDEILAGKGVV